MKLNSLMCFLAGMGGLKMVKNKKYGKELLFISNVLCVCYAVIKTKWLLNCTVGYKVKC